MSKKKRPQKIPAGPPPVLHGSVFHTFIREAMSIGNEVAARRHSETDVEAYLKQKGLLEECRQWCEARRAPKTP